MARESPARMGSSYELLDSVRMGETVVFLDGREVLERLSGQAQTSSLICCACALKLKPQTLIAAHPTARLSVRIVQHVSCPLVDRMSHLVALVPKWRYVLEKIPDS